MIRRVFSNARNRIAARWSRWDLLWFAVAVFIAAAWAAATHTRVAQLFGRG